MSTADDFLALGPRIRVLPIIHGSGDFAVRAREELLNRPYDCLAVPLPPSFQEEVESAVEHLPTISAVVCKDADGDDYNYVPIDPCQGVIAAIRTAIGERIPREFIDLETPTFQSVDADYPDPYALKRVSPDAFAAAVLPAIPPPKPGQHAERLAWMADRLHLLEHDYTNILLVCSLMDWPWIRDAYMRRVECPETPESFYAPMQTVAVDPKTMLFFTGELPYITALYERGRRELTADDNLSIDGVKEMILHARDLLKATKPKVAARATPHLLSTYLHYVRNLTLVNRRLRPDLYTLVVAAQQTVGDDYALAVAEAARGYAYANMDSDNPPDWLDGPPLRMGIGKADVPLWGPGAMASRLPGQAVGWGKIELRPKADEAQKGKWRQRWDPYGMCSWPPEDDRVESFHRHARDQARAAIGADLARSEKFTTSVMDGIDLRETLRNLHTGDLYVKVIPPDRGSIDAVVFLFDVPADPRRYVSRHTWYAEHVEESTLAFFATDPMADFVGPGIARSEYGGALFLYPPRPIPDIWEDPRLDDADTLEERLIGGALLHSREKHVALISPRPPSASWRRRAKRHKKTLVHLPLKRFGGQLVERLRTFHILNGKEVRSYAADFIRDG